MERRPCSLSQVTKDAAKASLALHKPAPTNKQKQLSAIDADIESHLSMIFPHNWLVKIRQIILNSYA